MQCTLLGSHGYFQTSLSCDWNFSHLMPKESEYSVFWNNVRKSGRNWKPFCSLIFRNKTIKQSIGFSFLFQKGQEFELGQSLRNGSVRIRAHHPGCYQEPQF